MSRSKVSAALPFPLPAGEQPYVIRANGVEVRLTIERRRHTNFDERIAAGGMFDLAQDRAGWASYSFVAAEIESAEPVNSPVAEYLAALNHFIDHARDLFNLFWLRNLEVIDLFQLVVLDENGAGKATILGGRTGGVTTAQIGIRPDADRLLRARMAAEQPPLWRMIQLDAQEAFATARYEDACVLVWSAIESFCRQSLPSVARAAGVEINDLRGQLGLRDTLRFLSLQEVVARSGALTCIERMAALSPSASYSSMSLRASLGEAYSLRNRVVHEGTRVSKAQAKSALDAVAFVLRCIEPPQPAATDALDGWREHFGGAHPILERWAERAEASPVVLYNAVRWNRNTYTSGWWDFNVRTAHLAVYVLPGVPESVAACLLLANYSAYTEHTSGLVPSLRATESGKQVLVPGLLDGVAHNISQTILFRCALGRCEEEGLPVAEVARYALRHLLPLVEQSARALTTDDVRFRFLAAQIATYLTFLPRDERSSTADTLTGSNRDLSAYIEWLLPQVESVDISDPHSTCELFRSMHAEAWWLDSIVVDCPIEGRSFGSTERELGQPD